MDIPSIPTGPISGVTPVNNSTPDLSGLNSIKTEGAQKNADGSSVNKGSEKSSVTGSGDVKADSKDIKTAVEKIRLGEGEEYSVAELKTLLEKAKGADKKFLEAAQIKKAGMKVLKMAKEDPRGFLEKTGLDPKKFSYDEVAEDVKNQLRDPREIELEKATKKIEQFEKQEAERKSKIDAEKQEKATKALQQQYHNQAIEALEAFPELPKTAHIVAELARAVMAVKDKHNVVLSMKEVAPMVVRDIRARTTGLTKGASAEQLIALIGQEGVDLLLKHSMAKLKDPLKGGTAGAVGQDGEPIKETKKYKNSHHYWKTIDDAAKEERERGGR